MSAKNRKNKSIIGDKYYTPNKTIEHFMKHGWQKLGLDDPKTILDPCCGMSAFKNVLSKQFIDCNFTQLDNDSDSNADILVDYKKYTTDKKFDLVISNPPYTLAQEFVENALNMSNNVIYLLRLNFLGSQKRESFFNLHMPSNVFIIPNRPSFTSSGTDATEYCFMHFNNQKNDYSKIYRLPVM